MSLIVCDSPTPRPYFMPVCFTPSCFNTPCRFTPLLTSSHFWFDDLWLVYFHLPFFSPPLREYHFWFTPFIFTPTFSGTQLGRKTRPWCVGLHTISIICLSTVMRKVRAGWCSSNTVLVFGRYVTATRLWTGRSGVRIPAGTRYSSFLQNVQTGSEVNPASYSIGTRVISRG